MDRSRHAPAGPGAVASAVSVRQYRGKKGQPAKSTRWQVVIELGEDPETGKRKQLVIRDDPETGLPIPTKKRAQEIEREEYVKRARPGYVDPDTTPLAAFLDRWLTETRDTRVGGTEYHWRSIVKVRIAPELGDIPLARLTALDLQAFYREQAERYAPKTVECTRAVLAGALKAAVRWRLLERSPHDGVRLPKGETPERPVWTAEEARAFLAKTGDARFGALWRLLLDSGMRLGEALALRWSDLDEEARTVFVGRTVALDADGKRGIVARTKTGSGRRTIVLDTATLAALRRHRVRQHERRLGLGEYWHDDGLIFDRYDGRRVDDTVIRRAFAADLKTAPVTTITPHSLRHTCFTLAAAAGVPLHAIMKRAGHRSIAMTANLYAHASRDADRQASEAIAKALSG